MPTPGWRMGWPRRSRNWTSCSSRWARAWDGHEVVDLAVGRLRFAQLTLRRIAARVRQGGHDVPRADVVRRFSRGWENFQRIYRPLADSWAVYDNSGRAPRLLEKSP